MTNTPTHQTIGVRLPMALYLELQATAKAEHRSVSKQAWHFIAAGQEEYLDSKGV